MMDHSYVSRQHPPVEQEPSSNVPRSPAGRRTGRTRSVSESGQCQIFASDASPRLTSLATPGRTSGNTLHDSQTKSERPRKSRHASGKVHHSGRNSRDGRSPNQEGSQARKLLYPPISGGSREEEENSPETKRSRTAPLPDIMHDWEIIVKSLKANERREKQEVTKASGSGGDKSHKGLERKHVERRNTDEATSTNRKLDFSEGQQRKPEEPLHQEPSTSNTEADSDKENTRLNESVAREQLENVDNGDAQRSLSANEDTLENSQQKVDSPENIAPNIEKNTSTNDLDPPGIISEVQTLVSTRQWLPGSHCVTQSVTDIKTDGDSSDKLENNSSDINSVAVIKASEKKQLKEKIGVSLTLVDNIDAINVSNDSGQIVFEDPSSEGAQTKTEISRLSNLSLEQNKEEPLPCSSPKSNSVSKDLHIICEKEKETNRSEMAASIDKCSGEVVLDSASYSSPVVRGGGTRYTPSEVLKDMIQRDKASESSEDDDSDSSDSSKTDSDVMSSKECVQNKILMDVIGQTIQKTPFPRKDSLSKGKFNNEDLSSKAQFSRLDNDRSKPICDSENGKEIKQIFKSAEKSIWHNKDISIIPHSRITQSSNSEYNDDKPHRRQKVKGEVIMLSETECIYKGKCELGEMDIDEDCRNVSKMHGMVATAEVQDDIRNTCNEVLKETKCLEREHITKDDLRISIAGKTEKSEHSQHGSDTGLSISVIQIPKEIEPHCLKDKGIEMEKQVYNCDCTENDVIDKNEITKTVITLVEYEKLFGSLDEEKCRVNNFEGFHNSLPEQKWKEECFGNNDVVEEAFEGFVSVTSHSSDGGSRKLIGHNLIPASINTSDVQPYSRKPLRPVDLADDKKACHECQLVFETNEEKYQHRRVGHRRIYECMLDEGHCGKIIGAVQYHAHLWEHHEPVIVRMLEDLSADVASCTMAGSVSNLTLPCRVCLCLLAQPTRQLHELLVHGQMSSMLTLSSPSPQASVWWTGKGLSWTCHQCCTTPSVVQNPQHFLMVCAPHAFPKILANHLVNVHLLSDTLLHGWWLLLRLLHVLPPLDRSSLASMLALGLHNNISFARCLICKRSLAFIVSPQLNESRGLCGGCWGLVKDSLTCWFLCGYPYPSSQSQLIAHLIANHKSQLAGGWCVLCGQWASALLPHVYSHTYVKKCVQHFTCNFCPTNLIGQNILSWVVHSWAFHVFPCPFPTCRTLHCDSEPDEQSKPGQTVAPTSIHLASHINACHLPSDEELNLDEISLVLQWVRGGRGGLLSSLDAQALNTVWYSHTGDLFTLIGAGHHLTPSTTVKIWTTCVVCGCSTTLTLRYADLSPAPLCAHCRLGLHRCQAGPPWQCPAQSCNFSAPQASCLYDHLMDSPKHRQTIKPHLKYVKLPNCCSKCNMTKVFKDRLALFCHQLLSHTLACLICPYHAITVSSLQHHRTTCHDLRSLDAVWVRLKYKQQVKEKYKMQHPKVLDKEDGCVILVGISSTGGVVAQCDPLICVPLLMDTPQGNTQENSVEEMGNNCEVREETAESEDDAVPGWCGSLCTVSMSPHKLTPPTTDLLFSTEKNTTLKRESVEVAQPIDEPQVPAVGVAETAKTDVSTLPFGVAVHETKTVEDNETEQKDDEDDDSGSEPPLQIDTAAASPNSPRGSCPPSPGPNLPNPNGSQADSVLSKAPTNIEPTLSTEIKNLESTKNTPVTLSPKTPPTKEHSTFDKQENAGHLPPEGGTPTFGLVDTLNNVVAQTIRTMTEVLTELQQNGEETDKAVPPGHTKSRSTDVELVQAPPEVECSLKKKSTPRERQSRRGEPKPLPKGLGENADIDETSMGENILRDLSDKFTGQCVGCGVSVLLPRLLLHMNEAHPRALVTCTCGTFQGSLYAFLVHSFHLSHLPSEARPFVFSGLDGTQRTMVVLEARASPSIGYTFPCFKCGKRFKQEKSRQLHYNLCKLEKKFECEVCGEKFVRDHHLVKHKEWKHNPQTCPHCGKCFTSEVSLTQHVLHIHKKQLIHKCDHCGDRFGTRSRLRVHSRIHTGERPHKCQHCTQAFVSRNLLAKHVAADHPSQSTNYQSDSSEDLSKYKSRKHRTSLDKSVKDKSNMASDSDSDSSEWEGPAVTPAVPPGKIDDDDKVAEEEFQTRLVMLAMTESDLDTSDSESEKTTAVHHKKNTHGKQASNKQKALESVQVDKVDIYQHEELLTHHLDIQGKHAEQKRRKLVDGSSGVVGAIGGTVDENPPSPIVRENMVQIVDRAVGVRCGPCHLTWNDPAGKLLHMYLVHPQLVLNLGLTDCAFCDHSFTTADDINDHHLAFHQRAMLPNGTFRCLCGLVFREDGAYYFHLYYAHKAQRALNVGGEIVCRVCEARPRLNKIVDLVVHLSDTHTMFDHVRVNDAYMCNFCYKAFESWTVLSLHFFMVHKATKSQTLSYDCPYCDGASPWHSLEALQYHLDNVHPARHRVHKVPENSCSIYMPATRVAANTSTQSYSGNKRKKSITTISGKPPPKKRKRMSKKGPRDDGGSMEADETLYCICQCPYDEVSDMIGCDNPSCRYQWFHFE